MPALKKSKSGSGSNGFSFEFGGGGQKVKALVARKRPAPKPPATQSSAAPMITTKPQAFTPKKSMALREKQNILKKSVEESDSDLESYAKVKPATETSELMLNICSEPKPFKPTDKKLNRMERLKQKRLEKSGSFVKGKHVLSQRELKDGLRRFAENPNKKPRAADIFDMKEKAEHRAMTDDKQKQQQAAAEIGKVDANARKANAFRVSLPGEGSVKKINLFTRNPVAKVMGQRLVKPVKETIFDGTKVGTLGLHAHTVKNLEDLLSITELTTVQQKTIPHALQGECF